MKSHLIDIYNIYIYIYIYLFILISFKLNYMPYKIQKYVNFEICIENILRH